VIKARRNRPNKGVNGENTQDPEAAYNVKTASDGKKKSSYDFKAMALSRTLMWMKMVL
jgi:IS5 family transposase